MGNCCGTQAIQRNRITKELDLLNSDDSVQKFSLNGLITRGKCVKVHDGDSVHMVIKYYDKTGSLKLMRFACRLRGIDAAELSGPNAVAARSARDFLKSLIFNIVLEVKCYEFDKYGRLLVELTLNGVNVNQKMIEDGYAKPYDGGKKI